MPFLVNNDWLSKFEAWQDKALSTYKATLQGSKSKLTKKSSRNFAKFSRNLATLSRRIFPLNFLVSGLAKQNMSPQYLCVKKPLKMARDA